MSRFIETIAEWLALLGGVLLVLLAVMVTLSVSGRALLSLGLGPIPGDFELVEMATAIVVFFFLPWCHLKNGHAAVDLLHGRLPPSVQRVITIVSDTLMTMVWLVLTWRLGLATLEKLQAKETSFILQIPLGWAYALCWLAAVMGCLIYAVKTLQTCIHATNQPARGAA